MDNQRTPDIPQEDLDWLQSLLSDPGLIPETPVTEESSDLLEAFLAEEEPLQGLSSDILPETAASQSAEEAAPLIPVPLEIAAEPPAEALDVPDAPQPEFDIGDTGWLDQILASPELSNELGPDEHAVYAAGLTHPEDAELERIIEETKTEEITQTAEPAPIENLQAQTAPFVEEELRGIFTGFEEKDQPASPEEVPEVPASEAVADDTPVKKRRPLPKKGYGLLGIPQILSTLIWLAMAVVIGISLGRLIWVCASDVLAFGREDKEVVITIEETDTLSSIADKLKEGGLIRYPSLFKQYAKLTDAMEDISPGTFTLNTLYDYHALVSSMTVHSSAREVVKILIPEGYTCAQIFQLLEEKGVCTVAELEEYAANGDIGDYWFLEGVTRGDRYCLEGYLFPDTYEFYTNDTPGRVFGKFLSAFDYRYTDVMKDKLAPLNERYAKALRASGYSQEFIDSHKLTIRDVVIIASMIEKETSGTLESYTISSVIYNRLAWDEPRYLNIDATLIYALGGNIDPVTGETKPLTDADLKLDSPYNTYTNLGLIPGPISNPGTASLNAALDPDDTDYYYYVYSPRAGCHLFAETYKQHQKNVASVEGN